MSITQNYSTATFSSFLKKKFDLIKKEKKKKFTHLFLITPLNNFPERILRKLGNQILYSRNFFDGFVKIYISDNFPIFQLRKILRLYSNLKIFRKNSYIAIQFKREFFSIYPN